MIFCLQPDLPPSPSDAFLKLEENYQRPPLPTDIFDLMQNFHDIAENYQECVAELVQDRIEFFSIRSLCYQNTFTYELKFE